MQSYHDLFSNKITHIWCTGSAELWNGRIHSTLMSAPTWSLNTTPESCVSSLDKLMMNRCTSCCKVGKSGSISSTSLGLILSYIVCADVTILRQKDEVDCVSIRQSRDWMNFPYSLFRHSESFAGYVKEASCNVTMITSFFSCSRLVRANELQAAKT